MVRRKPVLRCAVLALIGATSGCSGASVPDQVLPYTGETESVSITLYNDAGNAVVSDCVIDDARKIREIIDCMTPYMEVERGIRGPIVGRLELHGPRGTIVVEFPDAGMNPLVFSVGDKALVRDAPGYRGRLSDHKRLYDLDHDVVDESRCFYRKLLQLCPPTSAQSEEEPETPPRDGGER
jgi:hypothetical protein